MGGDRAVLTRLPQVSVGLWEVPSPLHPEAAPGISVPYFSSEQGVHAVIVSERANSRTNKILDLIGAGVVVARKKKMIKNMSHRKKGFHSQRNHYG